MTGQQATLLEVQSGQLELQRQQLDEQRQVNARQVEVLELQAEELRASREQRERGAEEQRRKQAARVTAWFSSEETPAGFVGGARIRNASDQPVYDVRVFFHLLHEVGSGHVPVGQAGPPPRETTPVVPSGEDRFIPIPAIVQQTLFGTATANDRTCAVSIEFTDAAGNRWTRDPRGALVPGS